MGGEIAQHIKTLQLFCHLLPGQIHIGQAVHRFRRLLLIVKVDHRIEAVAVIIALHHAVAPGFTGHPEWRIVEFFVRVGGFPRGQRLACLVFQLLPGFRLNVLSGIDPEAVDAVVTYPLAEPVGQVISRREIRHHFRVGVGLVLIKVRQT